MREAADCRAFVMSAVAGLSPLMIVAKKTKRVSRVTEMLATVRLVGLADRYPRGERGNLPVGNEQSDVRERPTAFVRERDDV
jgi:hypothetical protein